MIRILLSTLLGARRWTQMTDRVSLEQLDLICEALDCKLTDLIVWEPNNTPKLDQAALKTLHKKK